MLGQPNSSPANLYQRVSTKTRQRLHILYLAVGAFALVVGITGMLRVRHEVGQPFGGFIWGWTFITQGPVVGIGTPWHWPGPQQGLRGDDRILAVDGQDPMKFPSIYKTKKVGEGIDYRVRRGKREFTVRVSLSHFTMDQFIEAYASFFLIGLSLTLAGYILMRSASDRPSILVAFTLLSMAGASLFHSHSGGISHFYLNVPLLLVLFTPSYPLVGAFLTHFFLLFPRPLAVLRRRPWLVPMLYAGAIVLIFVVVVASKLGGLWDTVGFRLSLLFAVLGILLCTIRSLWAFVCLGSDERGHVGGLGVVLAMGSLLLIAGGVIPFFSGGTSVLLTVYFLPLTILYPLVLVFAMRNMQDASPSRAIKQAEPVARHKHKDFSKPLTSREIDVLRLVAQGMTNDAIAETFSISKHTVPTHLRNIYRKLGVTNRTAAVHEARRRGIL